MSKPGGFLEIGHNLRGEVVLNMNGCHETDEYGNSHIVFSPEQARELAEKLMRRADEAETLARAMGGAL